MCSQVSIVLNIGGVIRYHCFFSSFSLYSYLPIFFFFNLLSIWSIVSTPACKCLAILFQNAIRSFAQCEQAYSEWELKMTPMTCAGCGRREIPVVIESCKTGNIIFSIRGNGCWSWREFEAWMATARKCLLFVFGSFHALNQFSCPISSSVNVISIFLKPFLNEFVSWCTFIELSTKWICGK